MNLGFTMEYQEFLKSKIKISENYGFKVDMGEINPKLKPHNKLMVKWLVECSNPHTIRERSLLMVARLDSADFRSLSASFLAPRR